MKKLISLIAVVLLLMCAVLPASAADGQVTYSGNAGEFIFAPGSTHSPTDLFPDFKGVMPGDTLTQKITVKNDADRNVKVKIYLRALGAQEADFLSQLSLRVRKNEDNEGAYMFDAAASETAQLSHWVCLGTLYSGGAVELEVILDVPAELDNSYQNQVGYLDWEFLVEEFPVEDTDPQPPDTGDSAHIGLWLAVMLCAGLSMIMLLVWRKKGQEQKDTTAQL